MLKGACSNVVARQVKLRMPGLGLPEQTDKVRAHGTRAGGKNESSGRVTLEKPALSHYQGGAGRLLPRRITVP